MMDILMLDIFSKYPEILHAISTKASNSMKKDDGSLHFANLLKFAKFQKFPAMPITMEQVHSAKVAVIENDRELVIHETDGMVTNKKRLPLAVKSADCLPILFYDPQKHAIGVAHAGRKGLGAGIIQKTITTMRNEFHSEPKDIIVGIGPSIEKKCYEVSHEIIDEFKIIFSTFENIYEEKEGKYFLDLRSIAMQSLRKEGILDSNIVFSKICTRCDETFFSYRRGDKNGLFVSILSLL